MYQGDSWKSNLYRFNIFKCENVHRSIFPVDRSDSNVEYKNYIDLNADSTFSFSRFCNLSPREIEDIHITGTFCTLLRQNFVKELLKHMQYAQTWDRPVSTNRLLFEASNKLPIISIMETNHDLIFTRQVWLSRLLVLIEIDNYINIFFSGFEAAALHILRACYLFNGRDN